MSEPKDIKMPFSTFDIFSNLIPAIIFILGLLWLSFYANTIRNGVNDFNHIFEISEKEIAPSETSITTTNNAHV